MNFIKKLFSKNKNNYIDENVLYSSIIYNTRKSIIVLFSYTEPYFYSMIEFITACSKVELRTISTQIDFETDPEEPDVDKEFVIKPEKILKQRQYVICSGPINKYVDLYKNLDLGNEILISLQEEIYEKVNSVAFGSLINDGILDKSKFKYIDYKTTNYDAGISIRGINIVNTSVLKRRLPNGFSIRDILYILTSDTSYFMDMIEIFTDDEILTVVEPIIGSKDINKFRYIVNTPKYLLDDEYGFIGDIEDETLDDIFKEKYNRFNAIDEVVYMDIDEALSDDIPLDKPREEDEDETGESV